MKKMLIMLAVGLVIGISVSAAAYFSLREDNQDDPPKTIQDISVEQIKEVAKIISVEYYMADVVTYQNNQMWPFSDEQILVIAKAKILAGFDLNKGMSVTKQEMPEPHQEATPFAQEAPVAAKQKTQFIITLPPPEIIGMQTDYRYYNIQGSPPADAHTYVLNLAKVTLYDAAKREGILQQAKVSCQKQMQQLFSQFDVIIHFQDEQIQG